MDVQSQAQRGKHRWRRAFAFARPHRGPITVIVAVTLVTGAASALEPLVLRHVFDGLADGATGALLVGVGLLLGLGLLREALGALSNWLTWRTRLGLHFELLDATVSRLHTLPVAFHRSEGVGSTMTKLDRGIQGFVGGLTEMAFNVLPALVYLMVSLVIMVRLEWRLALAVLLFVPLPAILGAWAAPEQTRRERSLLERWAAIYARFNEVLYGIVTVKSFAREDEEKRRFLGGVRGANDLVVRGVGRDTKVGAARNVVVLLANVAAIGAGGFLVARGETTVGTVIAFLGYVAGLFGPVQGLTNVYQTVRKASVALDTIFEILDQQDSLGDAPDAEPLREVRGEVRFEGVHFAYEPQSPIIRGVDLVAQPGEMVALVGPSGGGKSTLMALLQRLYDPTGGAITVDGRDLRQLKQRSLRENIGVVLQDALLFSDSVRANIAYGRPEASLAEIVAAAEAANAHDFICRLPEGYDTKVGERGGRLSMGQRQRVAIARALLKAPPILILDEATSALDAESEALVQEALGRLVEGRTTFVIAHRLSTVVNADRILVLQDGQITETGTHAELLAAKGYYASLVRHQLVGLSHAA